MIAKCHCTPEAQEALKIHLQGYASDHGAITFTEAEIEFRELPYLFVLRSREQWQEGDPDPHAVRVINANASGLVINPGRTPQDSDNRRVFVPWANIISLTLIQSHSQNGV